MPTRYKYSLMIRGKKCAYELETFEDLHVEDFTVTKEIVGDDTP